MGKIIFHPAAKKIRLQGKKSATGLKSARASLESGPEK
jgi:hypothetical protein